MGNVPDSTPVVDDTTPASKKDLADMNAWIDQASRAIEAKRNAGGITHIVYCVANQKGGVGKTTTTINIAACLSRIGLTVAVWDLDPQYNATIGLGLRPNKRGTYFLLEDDEADVRDLLQPTKFPNMFVVPGHERLELLVPGISSMPNGKRLIAEQTPRLQGHADVSVIDTPGNLSILTTNGLYAGDRTIVPFTPGAFELKGIKRLDDHIAGVANDRPDYTAKYRRRFGIDHVIVTSYSGRENVSKDSVRFVAQHYPEAYIDAPVVRRTGVTSSQAEGAPITMWEPGNAAAIGFMKVTRTIVERDMILV